MELKMGKMTGQELAEWFGISYKGSYLKRQKRYQAVLKNFCEFTSHHGYVDITEIHIPVYIKDMNRTDDLNFLEEIKRCEREQDGLSSIAGMVQVLKNKPEYAGALESSIYYRLRKSGLRLFGKMQNGTSCGPAGMREYEWAIKMGDYNIYRHLTPEEKEKFNEYTLDWSHNLSPQEIQHLVLLEDREIGEQVRESFYEGVIQRFLADVGQQIARATKHQILCDDHAKIAEMLINQSEFFKQ